MAEKGTWDYEAPQFVDFALGIDLSNDKEDEVFFDCDDQPVPEGDYDYENLLSPGAATKNCKGTENLLMSKMTAALKSIGNTPRMAMIRKHQMETNTSKKPVWRFGIQSHYKEAPPTSSKMTRSKSITNLNKINIKPFKEMGLKKRSSSLSDLRTVKKQTFPLTPMCLKRTMKKKVIKSTEQIELEEIARLQKQLKQHLRYNELSLKKLNLKPRQGNPKSCNPKPQHARETCNQGAHFSGRLAFPVKEKRRDLNQLSHEAFKKEASKAEAVLAKHKAQFGERSNVKKCTQLKLDSETGEKGSVKVLPKPAQVLPKKIGFHSGLYFLDSMKKTTVVKPFNFCTKPREVKAKTEVTCAVDMDVQKVESGKENIPVHRVQPFSIKSNNGGQIQKVDSLKFLESVKKIVDLKTATRRRGLSENINAY